MKIEIFLLTLIPIVIYLFMRTKKSLHMLQQNWYNEASRYSTWIMNNLNKSFNLKELIGALLIAIAMYINIYYGAILFTVLYIIIGYIYYKENKNEQSKKPLVVTKRVQRLIVALILLYILPFAIYYYFNGISESTYKYYYLIIFILVLINFVITWLANIVNIPVEKYVFHHFRRQALKKLRGMSSMKIIGITGSYGKTSSKNILNDVLNIKFNSFATPKNFNTMYGLIGSVNNHLDKFSDVFIAEMGAFVKGDIKELSDFIKPQYGILTKVGVAHLETFGNIENIQSGKFELIESLPSDGVGILNRDDEYQVSYKLKNNCKILWIGIDNEDVDVFAKNIKLSNTGTTFDVVFKGDKKVYKFETRLLGKANIYNILGSIALGKELGLTISQLQQGVKSVNSIEHRLELKKFGNINIIDDAYNSNPVGAEMALEVLSMMPGKKIIVTPGMIDLGEEQYNLNKIFGEQIAKSADEVVLIGKEQTKPIYDGLIKMKYKEKNIYILNDVKDAFILIQKLQGKETYVLLENDLPDLFNEKE